MITQLKYMARQKRDTVSKTTRLIVEIAEAIQKYADDQIISENAAINQLLQEGLLNRGYLNKDGLQTVKEKDN